MENEPVNRDHWPEWAYLAHRAGRMRSQAVACAIRAVETRVIASEVPDSALFDASTIRRLAEDLGALHQRTAADLARRAADLRLAAREEFAFDHAFATLDEEHGRKMTGELFDLWKGGE